MKTEVDLDPVLSIVAICLDQDSLTELRNAVAPVPVVRLRSEFPRYVTAGDDSVLFERAELYVVDMDEDRSQALHTVERIHEAFGQSAVIGVSSDARADLLIRAMQAGCTEYLVKPLAQRDLAEAVARVKAKFEEKQSRARGQVWSFLGVKGGLGVTTLASHLASLLAKLHGRRTLLIDHHPQLGEASFYLALERQSYHFSGLVENSHRLDADLVRGYVARHASGLDVLPCPDAFDTAGSSGGGEIERTLAFLASRYEFVLIDCPHGLNPANMAAIAQSDRIYLVVTPEVSALGRVRPYLDCLDEWHVPAANLRLVVNRYSEKGITELQIQKATRRQVAWKVPNQYHDVVQAINSGTPLALSTGSEYMSNMVRWADILANKSDVTPYNAEPAKGKAGSGRFFSLKPVPGP